jgi:succinyl-CoA synthetase beta subunit
LLRDYGIDCAPTVEVATAEKAVAAADHLGYPVVLKTSNPGVLHKTDVDGVRIALSNAAAVRAAYQDLATRLGRRVLVQPHMRGEVEVSLGIVRDPLVGPLVLVATGGTLVEVLHERVVALPRLAKSSPGPMLARLAKLSSLLGGVRGGEPADVAALTEVIAATAQLAVELGQDLEALDINPVVCGPHGAAAVDTLVIHRAKV